MKARPFTLTTSLLSLILSAGPALAQKAPPNRARIVFLHHSTGECVWNGGVAKWFGAYNAAHKTDYRITEQAFPKDAPYGWENYPYDYWNIWVRHAGAKAFKTEPTLERLTGTYDVVVFKHCFPVSQIEADTGRANVTSSEKRTENYKLQYAALKKKLRQFPKVRFLVWTGAALTQAETSAAAARRAKAFFQWVRATWDQKGDNIYVWDFHALQTEGGLYLKPASAQGANDSHPNEAFSRKVAPFLCQRIVDVIAGRGDTANVAGRGGKPLPTTPAKPKPTVPKPTVPKATTAPAAIIKLPAGLTGQWVFDNAEGPAKPTRRWLKGVAYAREAQERVLKVNFAAGDEEDWGEYGKQRVIRSRPPARNFDLKPYKYLALRVKADREMEVLLGLMTLPNPAGRLHQPHFSFNGYIRAKAGGWTPMVFDLTKLELAVEGAGAYTKAGKPPRPMQLTCLRLCTNAKHQKAAFLLDDLTFLRQLPKNLKRYLQTP